MKTKTNLEPIIHRNLSKIPSEATVYLWIETYFSSPILYWVIFSISWSLIRPLPSPNKSTSICLEIWTSFHGFHEKKSCLNIIINSILQKKIQLPIWLHFRRDFIQVLALIANYLTLFSKGFHPGLLTFNCQLFSTNFVWISSRSPWQCTRFHG